MSYEVAAVIVVQLKVGVGEIPVAPLEGFGLDGALSAPHIITLKGLDQDETIEVWVEHLACALTSKLPAVVHVFEALGADSHPESVPSPQLKRYWIECPRLVEEAPVSYL